MTNDDVDPLDDESFYGLIMPFILCESQGGPLDDESFTIGYEIGMIDQELEMCETLYSLPRPRFVHKTSVPQLDLVAMRRGFVLVAGDEDVSGEWQAVEFKKSSDEEVIDE